MGLSADSKDVTIARLAVALTLQDARADDAEAKVAQLTARIAELEKQLVNRVATPGDILAQSDTGVNRDGLADTGRDETLARQGFGMEAQQVEKEQHLAPPANSNGHVG